jgi:hypothetical protein
MFLINYKLKPLANNINFKNLVSSYFSTKVRIDRRPPGSGKTHGLLESCRKYLKSDVHDKVMVISLSTRDAVDLFYNDLNLSFADRKVAKSDGIIVRAVSNSPDIDDGQIFISPEHWECSLKLIITTQAYLNNRGDTSMYYPLIMDFYILKYTYKLRLELYVDESHL